jgi:hypothetical chaperone protein
MTQPFAVRSQLEFVKEGSVGLDFGTTNSAVAMVVDSRPVLGSFETSQGLTHTFPSILYFERQRAASATRLTSSAGPAAIDRYLNAEDKGRLIQSLKAFLGDRRFDGTAIFAKHYTLEDLIALVVQHMLSHARQPFGRFPSRVVVGRPVHFSNSRDEADDEFALARLSTAVNQCGFQEIVFEYEPVAAAYSYERGLTSNQLILIGDFGGGTSDFSLLHVGPSVRQRGRTKEDILGSDGVAIAGDAFDRQIIRRLVAPRLGMGSEYLSPPKKFLPMPNWPYDRLERWHHVSFMNNSANIDKLERLQQHASFPERIQALIHLIQGELAYQLHEAVRRTKFELSVHSETMFTFRCDPVAMNIRVTRDEFEKWIESELAAISACVDRLLDTTGVSPAAIDHVFLTGGSAFVPAVRAIFVKRFGLAKISGGEELTSVAMGLALRAEEQWPSARRPSHV